MIINVLSTKESIDSAIMYLTKKNYKWKLKDWNRMIDEVIYVIKKYLY